jgi:chemotaxis protein methyltransferase CheR
VFCRNVLIYFDRENKGKVVEKLIDRLLPSGYLFLGHAESLGGFTTRARAVLPTVYTLAAPGAART